MFHRQCEEAKAIDEQVAAIESVTADTFYTLYDIKSAYNALTTEQQEDVTCLDRIQELEDEFNSLLIRGSGIPDVSSSKISESYQAYVTATDASVITVPGEVVKSALTSDGSTLVVLERLGKMYFSPAQDISQATVICENTSSINVIQNTGVIYTDSKDIIHRYLFSDKSDIEIGNMDDIAITVADDSLSVLYGDRSSIYLLPESSSVSEKVSSYTGNLTVEMVSNDGKTAGWVERDSSSYTVYLFFNGDRVKLFSCDESYSSDTNFLFNANETFLAVTDENMSSLYFMDLTESDVSSARLGENPYFLYDDDLYTVLGPLELDVQSDIRGLYLVLEGSSSCSLVYVDREGNRERLISNIADVAIANGKCYYVTCDDELFVADLMDASLGEGKKIASNINSLRISADGRYVYYSKGSGSDDVGLLYCYDNVSGINTKITGNLYSSLIGSKEDYDFLYRSLYVSHFYISADGSAVFYYEDVEDIKDSDECYGTLYYAELGKEPVKLSTDIILGWPRSHISGKYVLQHPAFFYKYVESCTDPAGEDNVLVNLVLYDGNTMSLAAKEVYLDNNLSTVSLTEN